MRLLFGVIVGVALGVVYHREILEYCTQCFKSLEEREEQEEQEKHEDY